LLSSINTIYIISNNIIIITMNLHNIFSSSNSEQPKKYWFSKKRIYPSDSFGCDNVIRNKITGLKMSVPFLIIVFVAVIASLA